MFHMIGQPTDFKTIWLSDTCASYMIVVINHLEGNFDAGLFIIRFLKMYFSKYNLTNFLSLKLNICCAC